MAKLLNMVTVTERQLHNREISLATLNAHMLGKLQNMRIKIQHFKERALEVMADPTLKSTIISNFEKTKEEIMKNIERLDRT